MSTDKTVTVDYEEFQSLVNFQNEILENRNKITWWQYTGMFYMIDEETGKDVLKNKFDEMDDTINRLRAENKDLKQENYNLHKKPWYKFW